MEKLYYWLKCVVLVAALALPGAALAATTIDFSDTTGFGLNANEVQIDNIRVDVEFANPFDSSRPTITSVYYNVPFIFNPTDYHLEPSLGGARLDDATTACASATIRVTDAFDGHALANVRVAIGSDVVLTDSSGQAAFSNLTAGPVSIEASVDDSSYENGSRTATLSCDAPTTLGLSLSPTTGAGAVEASDVRITLAWGENPRDLDSHLTGPNDGNNGTAEDANRFHTYFLETADVATLDFDNQYSYGPETITVVPPAGGSTLRPGIYRYTVHHYTGSGTIDTSGASVTLNLGGSQTREFVPPSDTTGLAGTSNDTWTVFELMVSSTGSITVLPVNTYGSGTLYGSVRSTTTGYGSVETGVDFSRLHK